MHLLIGKRQIILSALVVVLGLAVFVNWYYTGTKTELNPEGTAAAENGETQAGELELVNAGESDYFASVRLERTSKRDETMEQLQSVISQSASDSESAVEAAAIIDAMSAAGQCESNIESLVSSTVGSECVAVISDNTVEVVVEQKGLNDENVLKITDIVNSVCGNSYENIRICAALG